MGRERHLHGVVLSVSAAKAALSNVCTPQSSLIV
jgi:hypothetical protein